MANFVTFLPCILLVAPLILHECAANDPQLEAYKLVLQTYDKFTDPCSRLTPTSGDKDRSKANNNCWKSFEALGRLNGNECIPWAIAKCKKVDGSEEEQCSCDYKEDFQHPGFNRPYRTFSECADGYIDRVLDAIEAQARADALEGTGQKHCHHCGKTLRTT